MCRTGIYVILVHALSGYEVQARLQSGNETLNRGSCTGYQRVLLDRAARFKGRKLAAVEMESASAEMEYGPTWRPIVY